MVVVVLKVVAATTPTMKKTTTAGCPVTHINLYPSLSSCSLIPVNILSDIPRSR
jgi:hypothetical protein